MRSMSNMELNHYNQAEMEDDALHCVHVLIWICSLTLGSTFIVNKKINKKWINKHNFYQCRPCVHVNIIPGQV